MTSHSKQTFAHTTPVFQTDVFGKKVSCYPVSERKASYMNAYIESKLCYEKVAAGVNELVSNHSPKTELFTGSRGKKNKEHEKHYW